MPARINPFICEVISKLHNIITTVGGEGHIPLEYNCMLYRIIVILKSDTSTLAMVDNVPDCSWLSSVSQY